MLTTTFRTFSHTIKTPVNKNHIRMRPWINHASWWLIMFQKKAAWESNFSLKKDIVAYHNGKQDTSVLQQVFLLNSILVLFFLKKLFFQAWKSQTMFIGIAKISLTPKDKLSQMLVSVCDINRTRSYGNTCILRILPSGLCISDKALLACTLKSIPLWLWKEIKKSVKHWSYVTPILRFLWKTRVWQLYWMYI